ncbi:MAG: hypothetical protein U9N44_01555, partial [Chloroflexota bacterium]|nr:hypothetical protein [Chloroflexota bacterium]
MKLLKIISLITQTEISKFYNILTNVITNIDESINLEKSTDAEHFVKTFSKTEVYEKYKEELSKSIKGDIFLDIISDIIVRDGNSIMSRDWFKTLLEKEICALEERIGYFDLIFKGEVRDIEKARIRDYTILLNCTKTAYTNDLERGAETKITLDELSILKTLKNSLDLSNDEFRAILFYAIGTKELDKYDIDEVIKKLHDAGIAFYKKSRLVIYVPDEIVYLLREIKAINLADKYTRRILKCLDDKMINKVKKLHGIREVERHKKIEAIIKQGINIESVLSDEIFDDEVRESDKKKIINEIIESKLEIHLDNSGRTVNEKIGNLVKYFNNLDKDPNIGIARDGYEKLLLDLKTMMQNLEQLIRKEFDIEPRVELTGETLLDYNVRPKDVLYLLPITELKKFCLEHNVSYRGKNIINSILA